MRRITFPSIDPLDALAGIGVALVAIGVGILSNVAVSLVFVGAFFLLYAILATRTGGPQT